jgi:hypothetical protein
MGLFLDDLCVFVGVVVVWLAKGCKYKLWQKLKEVEPFDFFRRREGIIGLTTIIAFVCCCALVVHFLIKTSNRTLPNL